LTHISNSGVGPYTGVGLYTDGECERAFFRDVRIGSEG